MKTKPANKKGEKRSFSETTLLAISEQKSQSLTEPKKSSKKIKIDDVQNGSSMSANKTGTSKKADKQKNKSMKAKWQNKESNEESSINETVSMETKDKNLSKIKQKKLEFMKKKQLNREVQKATRKETGRSKLATSTLNVEQIKDKIAEIRSRKELSKTAKKKLSVLVRKLNYDHQAGTFLTIKQKANDKSKLKAKQEHANTDESVDDQDDNDEEESEDQSDIEEEEEGEEKEDEGAEEEEEEEEEEEDMDIAEKQSDNESDEDEEDEESDDEEATTLKVKKEKKKQAIHTEKFSVDQRKEEGKKKRFVLFVGNLPFELTTDELKQHFLTKVDEVISIRIPTKPGTRKPRGFAYVEVSNKIDYEKGLSLHHTFLKKRKINVQYTAPGSKDGRKPDIIAKNKKLEALRKAGKLAGSQGKKKSFKKMK